MSKLLKFTYESLGEALRESESTRSPVWQDRSSRQNDRTWSGTDTFQEAIAIAREGWPEGRRKMVKAVTTAASFAGFATTPAYALDVAGAFPHCAIAATGDAFCMVAPSPVSERAKPIVRLTIATAVSAMVSADSIFNYGAALLAFVDGLEANDIRTEISLCYAARKNEEESCFLVRVKAAEDVLDLDRLAFALACPAMWRRVVFSLYELNLTPQWERGYGHPRDPKAGKDFDPEAILLPSAQSFDRSELSTPEKAFSAIAPKIQELLSNRFAEFPKLSFETHRKAA